MALKTKIGLTEFESLNEAFKTEYAPTEDGTAYELILENDDINKLKIVRDKERELAKQAKKQASELEKRLAEYEAKLKKPSNDDADDDDEKSKDIKSIVEKQVKTKLSAYERQMEEEKAKAKELEAQNEKLIQRAREFDLTNALSDLLTKTPELDSSSLNFLKKLALIEGLKQDETSKDFANDEFYSLRDWVNAKAQEYPTLYKQSIGAGARGGKGGVVKAVTLEEQILNKFNNAKRGK